MTGTASKVSVSIIFIMSNLHFSCIIACFALIHFVYVPCVIAVNLCDPFSLVFTTNFTPPNTFDNTVSFNFSLTLLRLREDFPSKWDHEQNSNYTTERELFKKVQEMLRNMHKHIENAAHFIVQFECVIESNGDCKFSLTDHSRELMHGTPQGANAIQSVDTIFTISLRRSIFDLLTRNMDQLLKTWRPTCEKLLLLDGKQISEHAYYYFPDNSSVVCTFIVATPMEYSMTLLGDGLVSVSGVPDLSNEEFMLLVAQNITPLGLSVSHTRCLIKSPSGWSIRLSNPVPYNKHTLSTPTVERYPTTTPVTEIKSVDHRVSTAFDGTSDFQRNTMNVGIASAVIILVLAVVICTIVFRRRLGLYCIDECINRLQENIANRIRYTPSRSRNIP